MLRTWRKPELSAQEVWNKGPYSSGDCAAPYHQNPSLKASIAGSSERKAEEILLCPMLAESLSHKLKLSFLQPPTSSRSISVWAYVFFQSNSICSGRGKKHELWQSAGTTLTGTYGVCFLSCWTWRNVLGSSDHLCGFVTAMTWALSIVMLQMIK